jgi:hypothetical protein
MSHYLAILMGGLRPPFFRQPRGSSGRARTKVDNMRYVVYNGP